MSENGQKYHPLHIDKQNIDDGQQPAQPSGVWATLGMLANRLKAVTGRSTWQDAPPTNLTEAKAHHDATGNVHNLTRAQLGAAAATDLDSHKADQQNPHAVSAAQAGAPPTSRTISTTAPLSGGGNLSANRTLSITPASQAAAGSMSAADKAKLDGLDGASYASASALSSHVGSRDGHPLATTTQNGLQAGADKSKLDSLAIPPRIYVAPSFSRQDITVTTTGWQSTLLSPEVTVPALGQPPTGFAWLIDVVGSIRFRNNASVTASLLVQIQYNRASVGSAVDGGNSGAAGGMIVCPLTSFGLTPPTLTQSFTVNFYMWADVVAAYNVFSGPLPTVRAYLVKV